MNKARAFGSGLTLALSLAILSPVHANATRQANPASWSKIKHIVIILLENTARTDADKETYLKSLLTSGAGLTHNFAVTHPSQPNYIALVAGTTAGVNNNINVNLTYKSIADLITAKGLTWKQYAENWPGHCFLGASQGTYYRKHVPFISFKSIQSSPAECAKVVDGTAFFSDVAANTLPTFSFYTPDIKNDGHDTGVAFAATWLQKTFGPVLANKKLLKNTLFIITFDEGTSSDNNIYTAFVGAAVKPGATSAAPYTHYSVLKTIETILNIGSLGTNDSKATLINDIWQP